MKQKILLASVFTAASFMASAQKSRPTYAITGDGNRDFTWMNIRQVDLSTGKVTQTLFERSKSSFIINDVDAKKSFDQTAFSDADVFTASKYPTSTMVAAAAFDERTDKLFFTPMKMGELRWMNLNVKNNKPEFFSVKPEAFKVVDPNDEATNITRMVIGADGKGYAMSNDGNHFFSFTTGKKPVVTALGNLIDADGNNKVSIHNKCTSWGGDMIADAYGRIYLISANHHVFVVDVNTRIATYKGVIQNLPGSYTTNAAAVTDDGEVIVGSANQFDGFYRLNINELKANKINDSEIKYNPSDFANANLLFQKEAAAAAANGVAKLPELAINDADAKVFPNPVTNSTFNVLFENRPEGRYTIVLSDLAGRVISNRTVSVTKGSQIEKINLRTNTAKGIYVVKVLDANKTAIVNEKIVVQ
ncbi:MAG: T9SS type A sorting domain-containing protein [Ferruginibacter sp.]|nr:T9SS type A sorting domain-containing protein [Ferruginibacter sp.]